MTAALFVLDLASVYSGMSNDGTLRQTIEAAKVAEQSGYRRICRSDAPHRSSLVIAEQFGALVALCGDRIDLRLGRPPRSDGLPSSMHPSGVAGLERLQCEACWPHGPAVHLRSSLCRTPEHAACLRDVPAIVHTVADPQEPHTMVSVSTVVADSTAEAERLALPNSLMFLRMARAAERNSYEAIGDLVPVTGHTDDPVSATGAEEVIVVPQGSHLSSKTRTLRGQGRLVRLSSSVRGGRAAAGFQRHDRGSRGMPRADPSIRRHRAASAGSDRRSRGSDRRFP